MNQNIELVINPRVSDLGDGLKVRRALPFQKKRMVGPFIFLDHMGPVELEVGHEMKVRSHPHIGLSTLTYLFKGELLHRDTLGYEQMIIPKEVNWMTAGKGIAHSETARDEKMNLILEGLQAWVALPVEFEDVEPSFVHKSAEEIPSFMINSTQWTLVAGEAFGKKSPVPTYSSLFYLVAESKKRDSFKMEIEPKSEGGVYISKGEIQSGDETFKEGELIVFKQGQPVEFELLPGARVAVIGGEVFPEKRYIWWNFVSSSQEKIEEAKIRWSNGGFGKVIHETTQIPLPVN